MADLKDIKLSSQDILKKQFAHKMKGYDQEEVDKFLDQIISDYETYNSIIEDLYGKLGKLQRELLESQRTAKESAEPATPVSAPVDDVKTYTPKTRPVQTQVPTNEISTNMELIQRVSTLERKVYNLEQRVFGMQNQ